MSNGPLADYYHHPPRPPSPDIHSFFVTSTKHSLPSPPHSVNSDTDVSALDQLLTVGASPTPTPSTRVTQSPASTPDAVASLLVPATSESTPPSFKFDPAEATHNLFTNSDASLSAAPAAQSLSAHHFERYLHYKALAAQAHAELSLSILEACASSMGPNDPSVKDPRNMLSSISNQPAPFFAAPAAVNWNPSFSFQQQLHAAQAQAQAHLQAHEAAQAAQAHALQQRINMNNSYMAAPGRPGYDPLWSRQSVSTSASGASPPFPSTPTFVPPPVLPTMSEKTVHPTAFAPLSSQHSSPRTRDDEEDDQLAAFGSPDAVSEAAASMSAAQPPIPNMYGGGRGYVPGKTPDDPKKRHKCHICGRGFARAFNLKSHVSTHDPLRPKPHRCPHPMCERSFSRLHDLERHRQGIHSDGPLVDAKRQGVSPSVVRAQCRMQRRAEAGGLI